MSPDKDFMDRARSLEGSYLGSDDAIVQSGFSGGRERWVAERSPLVEGIHGDGDFLDVGCANGLLAADVMAWAAERGFTVVPHGVDLGPKLIDLARARLPEFGDNFWVADAWTWEPDRQWTYVYSLLDLSPPELWCQWLQRLMAWVEPEGRLIVGSYGAQTPPNDPVEVAGVFEGCGWRVDGWSAGGDPMLTRFAWSEGVSLV